MFVALRLDKSCSWHTMVKSALMAYRIKPPQDVGLVYAIPLCNRSAISPACAVEMSTFIAMSSLNVIVVIAGGNEFPLNIGLIDAIPLSNSIAIAHGCTMLVNTF